MVDLRTPVLVVDDEAPTRRATRMMLRKMGFSDITEDDGVGTLATLKGRQFGLVLLDLNMKPISGLDLLKLARREPRLASTRFIMVTGQAEMQLVKAALSLGVSGYLVKPFNSVTLQQKISAVMQRGIGREEEEEDPADPPDPPDL